MFSIPRLPRLGRDRMEQRQERKSKSSSSRGRRLERRNAAKNIDYDAVGVSWASTSSDESPGAGLRTRSLDLSPSAYSNQTSFRVEGVEEVDQLCRNLGLSGPEDFAIPTAAWEARKARSSSELLPPSRLRDHSPTASDAQSPPATTTTTAPPKQLSAEVETDNEEIEKDLSLVSSNKDGVQDLRSPSVATGVTGGGQDLGSPRDGGRVKLNGVRPPPVISPRPPIPRLYPPKVLSPPSNLVLAPPPSMSRPVLDHQSSIWDLVRSFAPEDDDGSEHKARRSIDSEEDDDDFEKEEEEEEEQGLHGVEEEVRVGETVADLLASTSFSTSNDDDSSSTTTETMFVISPNGRFKRNIKSWMRGGLLGSGSFGTVYEGISDDGFFFAVKEVSLVDQGSNAKQCILQLEQEIALLSQFEHENIVQYLGTDKEEVKLYIFIELVTQGSLASLYQKYNLRDSQVSAYTRQILNGLSYLHDRNVVHRDIKCANILVDANGSVKLADFGLAKEITKFNMLKSCKGSVYWMAPEVVNPKRTYGPAADIWSLGCTVLEMLTRQIPYPNLEWTQALFRIGRGEPPPIPNSLSKDARDFIHQCIQVNPDDRPSAAELLEHPFVKRPLLNSAGADGSSHHRNRS